MVFLDRTIPLQVGALWVLGSRGLVFNLHALRWLTGFVAILCCACSARVVRSELLGTYSVTYPFGHGSLHLESDGRYEQTLQIGGLSASVKGEWSYTREGEWDILLLQNCLSATDGAGKLKERWETPASGACSPSVARRFLRFGAIEISDDEDYSYRKVSVSATSSALTPSPRASQSRNRSDLSLRTPAVRSTMMASIRCSSRNSARCKSSGSFWRMVCSITRDRRIKRPAPRYRELQHVAVGVSTGAPAPADDPDGAARHGRP